MHFALEKTHFTCSLGYSLEQCMASIRRLEEITENMKYYIISTAGIDCTIRRGIAIMQIREEFLVNFKHIRLHVNRFIKMSVNIYLQVGKVDPSELAIRRSCSLIKLSNTSFKLAIFCVNYSHHANVSFYYVPRRSQSKHIMHF